MKKCLLFTLLACMLFPAIVLAQQETQFSNKGFENFHEEGSGEVAAEKNIVPDNWNSLKNSGGTLGSLSNAEAPQMVIKSSDKHSGSASANIFSAPVTINASSSNFPGIITTGQFIFEDVDVTADSKNAFMTNRAESGCNMPFKALPDSLTVWMKFIAGKQNNSIPNIVSISAVLHSNTDFKLPIGKDNLDFTNAVGAVFDTINPTGGWVRVSAPFIYSKTIFGSPDPHYMLMNIMTSENLGDSLFVDDLEFIYNKKVYTTTKVIPHDGYNMQNINLPIIIEGAMYPFTNVLVELSDDAGSFIAPTTLTIFTTPDSIIAGKTTFSQQVAIPGNINIDGNYKIKIRATGEYIIETISDIAFGSYYAPQNLAVNVDDACCANLTWAAPSQGSRPAGYYVYRNNVYIANNVTSCSYSDKSIAVNTLYTWHVESVYANGKISDISNEVSGKCVAHNPIVNLSVEYNSHNCEATLSWDAPNVSTPNYYEIYKNDVLVERFYTSLTYTDGDIVANTDYKWDVIAVYVYGFNDISKSVKVSITNQCSPTGPVENLNVSCDNNCNATITWDKPTAGDPRYYLVYEGNSSMPDTVKYGSTTYTISISANEEFTWGVSAVYEYIPHTFEESEKDFIRIKCTPSNPVTNVEVTFNNNNCNATLKWKAPLIGTPSEYDIYKDGSKIATTSDLTFTDENVTYNVEQEWTIVALYSYDTEVESTNNPSVKEACSPYNAPTSVGVTLDGSCNATVTWNAPLLSTPVSYDIYRKPQGGESTFLGNVSADNELIYEDITNGELINNTNYYWCVAAVYEGGFKSNESCNDKKCDDKGTGVDEISEIGVKIYPNPASTYITIEGNDIKKVEIYSINGKLQGTKTTDFDHLNIRHYTPGIYTLRIYTANGVANYKMVIAK